MALEIETFRHALLHPLRARYGVSKVAEKVKRPRVGSGALVKSP